MLEMDRETRKGKGWDVATRTFEKPMAIVKPVAEHDPLWFRDAILYQIHVRSFFDSNDDGIGDFPGLTDKLDYIQNLGVTAIWLLPFFVSPLRDDGYDTADYTRINPVYGTLRDFETFLREAHRRDLRVVTEMVMNHTSDQHEWFQRSRRAKPGDPWRDFYVWSDTNERYREARVIFQDFEPSNWTWDPVAQAYYWHRFYHHQPDLNFDNPEVHAAVLQAIDFWLDLGVDGVRLDAVPYLYEREGTNCENLPETHAFLKTLRRHVDEKYADKMLLAEANQWPNDAAEYFGDGDECHMNFHFPLMPRLFMAVEREDRFPIIDILEQTPPIPDNCQWGIFLRNHDELTLEMVTDEERDYMYRAYAEDPRARVNLGIRRRLAPLLRDNRRKMELLNGLLLSLPGTPIIYYGDEICMGDNIYLGDRDGVRTPMQWNDDHNAGFSRANPQRLFLPVVIDAAFHYASRNVEVEQGRPHSMLWWMRRIIGLRKQHAAFGRGSMEFLRPDNPKVLAYLRQYESETLLVVANLSRYSQCVELDLSRFRGQTPVELFGLTQFPPIGQWPYLLTLGPHGFYWFQLKWASDEAEPLSAELAACSVATRWDGLFEGKPLGCLEAALPSYLKRQRWFAGKARAIQRARLLDVLTVHDVPEVTSDMRRTGWRTAAGLPATRLLIVRVDYVEGEPERYVLPVVFAQGEQERDLLGDRPGAGMISVARPDADAGATLCDTTHESEFWVLLYDAIGRGRTIPGRHGQIEPLQTQAFARLGMEVPRETCIHGGEQSNTSAVLGGRLIIKLFRQIREGENPDLEIGRYLTEQAPLTCVPQVVGALQYRSADGETYTLAVLHEYVANLGDAWTSALDELGRYLERIESELSGPPPADSLPAASLLDLVERVPPTLVQEMIGGHLSYAELLGQRTAQMHLALAAGEGKNFAPEPFTKLYQQGLYQSLRGQARRRLDLLRRQQPQLPAAVAADVQRLLEREETLLQEFRELAERPVSALRTRCHGDFHLGQVLFTGKDFVIIDFEGEPDRPISERRIKASPLRDVASMIRSLHYATHAVCCGPQAESPTAAGGPDLAAWLSVWYVWTSAAYLKAYLAEASRGSFLPSRREDLETLLHAYLLEKALYELGYELNNRPTWVRIPLEGILQLIGAK
jgi:maltose alpha-D-glucosyltransferase/alpha-amylase